jgi:hypothetical protein
MAERVDKKDEIAYELLESLDMYLEQMNVLQGYLRKGYMDMSSARASMGFNRIGSLQYDQRMETIVKVYIQLKIFLI